MVSWKTSIYEWVISLTLVHRRMAGPQGNFVWGYPCMLYSNRSGIPRNSTQILL